MKLGVELFQLLCHIDSQGGGLGKTAKEVPCHVGPKTVGPVIKSACREHGWVRSLVRCWKVKISWV
jgi:hypothetical protein